jgi:hypothetical protein
MRSVARAGIGLLVTAAGSIASATAMRDAETYAQAIASINTAHARQPGLTKESDLAKRIPATGRSALARLLAAKPAPELAPALMRAAEAALDLDLIADFDAIRVRLASVAPDSAAKLGVARSRARFIIRAIGTFELNYVEGVADVFDGILAGYDELFGFKEFSKVPGKKLRVRLHREAAITKPPHFAPQFPWHSEIDFPVADGAQFSSPTPQGNFLFYGLCHELGHVIAMWGDPQTMEDKHAWAHYTGVALVEHLSASVPQKPWMGALRDVRWRSLKLERANAANQVPPSPTSYGGVMALFLALHDTLGAKTIGAALNLLDEQKKHQRVNHVRYYRLEQLRQALEKCAPAHRDVVAKLFREV